MLGHHRHTSDDDGQLNGHICILSPTINLKKKSKKRFHSWTPSDKTFWIRALRMLGDIWKDQYIKKYIIKILICSSVAVGV